MQTYIIIINFERFVENSFEIEYSENRLGQPNNIDIMNSTTINIFNPYS